MKNKIHVKYRIILIIILMILSIATGIYSYTLKERFENSLNNDYNESFSEAVNCVNNVENLLDKAMISKSYNIAAENLMQVWEESNLAMVYLSRIPFDSENQSQTMKFLNQVSDYAYSLSRKNINEEDLTEEDFENLEKLSNYCLEFENILNQLADELYSGEITWNNINKNKKLDLAQEVDNVDEFSSIEGNFSEYEGLIYDGAYSEHIKHMEKKGLTGEEITEEKAKEKIKDIFDEEIEEIKSNGFLANADIPVYDFTVKLKKREKQYGVEITKKGGWLLELQNDRTVKEEKIKIEDANKLRKRVPKQDWVQ